MAVISCAACCHHPYSEKKKKKLLLSQNTHQSSLIAQEFYITNICTNTDYDIIQWNLAIKRSAIKLLCPSFCSSFFLFFV